MSIESTRISRRRFVAGSAMLAMSGLTAGGICAAAAEPASGQRRPPSETLDIGIIGAGGRGAESLNEMGTDGIRIVAICDVDAERAAGTFERFPDAKRYQDYRRMLEMEKAIDAVVVSTPDHMHAAISIMAMKLGKHVYCEKPLARTIHEARRMREVAAEMKVATQMGTQGHAYEGTRRAVEVIRSGAIGQVTELHVWSDRPGEWWPQGMERPAGTPHIPRTLDWDLWLGPAPLRPYHPAYVPFTWRGFWDFGTGAIGDMGIHNLDTAFWALELGLPESAQVKDSGRMTSQSPPPWSIIELSFPARGDRQPVKLTWYDGGKKPPADLFHGERITDNGSLAIGSKGTLYTRDWHGGFTQNDMFLLLPRRQYIGYQPPAPTLPRVVSHHREWVEACKGGPMPLSNFGYASVLTESLLLGNLALRCGRKIEWDAQAMKARNCPEADQYIRTEYRKGWTL